MHLTRLHFILLLILLSAVGLFVVQYVQRRPKKPPEVIKPIKPIQPAKPKIDKETIARKTIAIAGEYWKIAKKENRDLSRGQAILRKAKQEYASGNFDEAIELARQSIEEFKNAKKLELRYTVKRGDCLWNIAKNKRHYGRGSMWVRIWRANEEKIPDFDLIYSGQVLVIPK